MMTIKEFAKKYGLDYQFVWMALHDTGMLTHGTKNMKYSEGEIVQACGIYSFNKIDKHKAKIYYLLDCLGKINAYLEKDG